jgi:hypothetical protein
MSYIYDPMKEWFDLMLASQEVMGFIDWRTPLWFWAE